MQYFHIDAFTDRPFNGNPAGVVPVDDWPEDDRLRAMASEHKHAETAFVKMLPEDHPADAHLRWWTPAMEVELCGHATLAAAHAMREHLGWARDSVTFDTLSGLLPVAFEGDRIVLDFPARTPVPVDLRDELSAALGGRALETHAVSSHLLCVFGSADDVRAMRPDMDALCAFEQYGIIATAPGDDGHDVVSRFFAPRAGVPEDAVTGSAHCAIAPYWAERTGRTTLNCYQASDRGGEVLCTLAGERVLLSGRAVTYLEGRITGIR
ncbi:MAG: PhzF family phenazine biosynthesis protein [Planctomycetota bacterium]